MTFSIEFLELGQPVTFSEPSAAEIIDLTPEAIPGADELEEG